MSADTKARFGDWIETYSGRHFWPMDPRPEDICIEDIAHALSNICRFNGHTARHYSVAEHSLLCADYAAAHGWPHALQLACLLHDGSEAYLCDIPRPIKPFLVGYAQAEDKLQSMIYAWAGLPPLGPRTLADIKEADEYALHKEAVALLPEHKWAMAPEETGFWASTLCPDSRRTEENAKEYIRIFDALRHEIGAS